MTYKFSFKYKSRCSGRNVPHTFNKMKRSHGKDGQSQNDHQGNRQHNATIQTVALPVPNTDRVLFNNTDRVTPPAEMSRCRILKNVVLLCVALMLLFGAFDGLGSIQSSLHSDEGMGVYTWSIMCGTVVVSSFLFPKLFITFLGHKWCMVLTSLGYILWLAANGYARWSTMIISSVVLGLVATCHTSAWSSYLTITAQRYAELGQQSVETVTAKFFGIFFFLYRSCE